MFRKVVQGFTNAATKPGCLGPFQRSLPQQESALPNVYESNDRNVTGLSYKKNTTKVQQPEAFPIQHIGVSEFLLGRIPASGSSKPSLGGDVQFKKLRDVARLNSENKELKDGNQQLEALKSENEELNTKLQAFENAQAQLASKGEKISELSGQVTKLTEEKNQLDKDLNSTKQSLDAKDKELKNKNKELESKIQKLEELKSAYESQIKDLQEQLESRNKELEDNKDSKPSAVNAQGVKSKVNYTSTFFVLSGVCAVGASLATPYLAICAILAVAASVFLALGCHCLYKANTALSDVKVQQDSQLLLESRP
ncbi:MAG: hypothetical protein LJD31_04800 [Wolbachia endosymbiont of Menacanthus eurysternus]|nr:hypothetical protein [Wolbachia endosymbiont of Menacanthus eurysternus]